MTEIKRDLVFKYHDTIKRQEALFNRDYSDLFKYLKSTSFFDDPASRANHNNIPGGLAMHTMNFFDCLSRFIEHPPHPTLQPMLISKDMFDPLLVAIGHDANKIGFYKIRSWNRKVDNQWQELKSYDYNNATFALPSNVISVNRIREVFPAMSKAEELAIYWAEGFWSIHNDHNLARNYNNAQEYDSRILLTHFADMWASRYMEKTYDEVDVNNAIRSWTFG